MGRLEVVQRTVIEQLAVLDDTDLVTQLFRYLEHVGREEHRVALIDMLAHHLLELKRALRVKASQRLVEDPDRRVVDQRAHDHELLTHAVRIGQDRVAQRIEDAEALRVILDELRPALGGRVIDICHKVEILDSRQAQKVIGAVGHIAKLLFGVYAVLFDIDAVDEDRALGGLDHAGDGFDRRGFTRAVMTDKAGDGSVLGGKGDILHDGMIAVFLGEVLYLDQVISSFLSLIMTYISQ